MKRIICLALTMIFMVLSMLSCRNSNANNTAPTPAEQVESLIQKLPYPKYGQKDYNFKVKLDEIDAKYNALSDSEKQEVKNYNRVLIGREIFIHDWIDAEASEQTQRDVTYELLNPQSMQVNSCMVYMYKGENGEIYVSVVLDYSAQNRMGGYEREKQHNYYVFRPLEDSNENKYSSEYDYGTKISYESYYLATQNCEYFHRPDWN